MIRHGYTWRGWLEVAHVLQAIHECSVEQFLWYEAAWYYGVRPQAFHRYPTRASKRK